MPLQGVLRNFLDISSKYAIPLSVSIGVSELPFLRVPFPKEPGIRLKNRFCVFLDTHMSGYNLSSILEQVTTDSQIPENENSQHVLGNGVPARILRS